MPRAPALSAQADAAFFVVETAPNGLRRVHSDVNDQQTYKCSMLLALGPAVVTADGADEHQTAAQFCLAIKCPTVPLTSVAIPKYPGR